MKKAMIYYYVDSCVETKILEYKDDCGIVVEEGVIYIRPDGETKIVINKENFISLEKIENPNNKERIETTIVRNQDGTYKKGIYIGGQRL